MGDRSDAEQSEWEDIDSDILSMMLDEEPIEKPDCKASTSSSPSTAHELGLVLSDEEEEETEHQPLESNHSFSSFSDAFSQSKLSKGNGDVDAAVIEIQKMEAKLKQLKESYAKQKRLGGKSFTKYADVTSASGKERKATSRILSAKEESELRERLKQGSELHSGETDSEDDEDKRNPLEQRYNTHGQDIKRRIAHASKSQTNKRAENGHANKKSTMEKPGWKETDGALVNLGQSGRTSTQELDQNVTLDVYSGIKIV